MSGIDYYHGAAAQEHISNTILRYKMEDAAAQRDELIQQRDEALKALSSTQSTLVETALAGGELESKYNDLVGKLNAINSENRQLKELIEVREKRVKTLEKVLDMSRQSYKEAAKRLSEAYVAHNGLVDAVQEEVSDFKHALLELLSARTEIMYTNIRDQIENYMGTQLRFSQEPAFRREYITAVTDRIEVLIKEHNASKVMNYCDIETNADTLKLVPQPEFESTILAIQREEAIKLRRRHEDMSEGAQEE